MIVVATVPRVLSIRFIIFHTLTSTSNHRRHSLMSLTTIFRLVQLIAACTVQTAYYLVFAVGCFNMGWCSRSCLYMHLHPHDCLLYLCLLLLLLQREEASLQGCSLWMCFSNFNTNLVLPVSSCLALTCCLLIITPWLSIVWSFWYRGLIGAGLYSEIEFNSKILSFINDGGRLNGDILRTNNEVCLNCLPMMIVFYTDLNNYLDKFL